MKGLIATVVLFLLGGICGYCVGYVTPQEKIAEQESRIWALESYINYLNEGGTPPK